MKLIIADVRAFTATFLATLTRRITSTVPSVCFGTAVAWLLVPGPIRGEAARVDPAAEVIERDGDVNVFVGIDTDDDSTATG